MLLSRAQLLYVHLKRAGIAMRGYEVDKSLPFRN